MPRRGGNEGRPDEASEHFAGFYTGAGSPGVSSAYFGDTIYHNALEESPDVEPAAPAWHSDSWEAMNVAPAAAIDDAVGNLEDLYGAVAGFRDARQRLLDATRVETGVHLLGLGRGTMPQLGELAARVGNEGSSGRIAPSPRQPHRRPRRRPGWTTRWRRGVRARCWPIPIIVTAGRKPMGGPDR